MNDLIQINVKHLAKELALKELEEYASTEDNSVYDRELNLTKEGERMFEHFKLEMEKYLRQFEVKYGIL